MTDDELKEDMRRADDKAIVKEAIKEWMSEQLAEFGWFAAKSLLVIAFGGLMYAYVITRGFK